MNEESVSALLDGECSPAELEGLLRAMDQDAALRQQLARMALIQQVIRGAAVRPVPAGFADRVMAGLPETTNEESLSALLDGECSPAELEALLDEMGRDPSLRQKFARMALAQELRRGARVRPVPNDFADKVRAGLPAQPDPAATAGTVVPLPRRPSWQPVVGLAAAAGVAAAAVLALKPAPAPEAPVSAPVAALPEPEVRVADLNDEGARQLRNYLMAYNQSRAQNGLGGTLGYARYAAYTTDDAGGDR